jgi:hypothetical protein
MEDPQEHPSARIERTPSGRLYWWLPLGALTLALFLGFDAWLGAGPTITIHARAGHGLGVGDPLRYRGVNVGVVRDISLSEDLRRVAFGLRLEPKAAGLCREGSRFWIVRPQMAVDSVQGLETIVGARYLSVDPGELDGAACYEFEALDEPPAAEVVEQEGLELRLVAAGRSGLSSGARVTYRGIVVGGVLRTGLTSDGTGVEIEVFIRPAYAELVRSNTRFWSTGGLEVSMALARGLTIELDSLRSLVVGGIALATPTEAGPLASDGDQFHLQEGAPDDVDEWRPLLRVGQHPRSGPLVEGSLFPGTLRWKSGRLIQRGSEEKGWVLALPRGILGPRRLLALPEGGHIEGGVLDIGGQGVPLDSAVLWEADDLILREFALERAETLDASRVRFAPVPQDGLVLGEPADSPLPLSRTRLRPTERGWEVDEAFELEPSWNGALVFGLEDRRFIGLLLVSDEGCRVVPFQAEAW